jgi:hypothetical protein
VNAGACSRWSKLGLAEVSRISLADFARPVQEGVHNWLELDLSSCARSLRCQNSFTVRQRIRILDEWF